MIDGEALPEQSFLRRMRAPGPKRLLSIDGGGIRGLIAIEVLARLEEQLRRALGRDDRFVLSDYFDYVGGTSTGAIIATCVALGMPVSRIRQFYVEGAVAMLMPAPWFRQLHYRNVAHGLSAKLREVLGASTTLGDPRLRTLLLLSMRNVTTDSPWPLSNNPDAMYNRPGIDGCNLDLPLWQLVRASTAAPTYFVPEEITVGSQRFIFVDGAVTPYNNPGFLLFTMATLPEYRLGWECGEDRILLVSIGTGSTSTANAALTTRAMNLLYNVREIPSALIDAASVQQDLLCRLVGRCRFGDSIDSELGDLIPADGDSPVAAPFPKQFTYVRYDPHITQAGLDRLGITDVQANAVKALTSSKYLRELQRIGETFAARVSMEHFGPFDPTGRVAVLSGARADATDPGARFPAEAIDAVARRLIVMFRAKNVKTVICGASCGADLVALYAARQIGIQRRIVLSHEAATYRERFIAGRPSVWHALFDSIIEEAATRGELRVQKPPTSDADAAAVVGTLFDDAAEIARIIGGTAPMAVVVVDGEWNAWGGDVVRFTETARLRGIPVEAVGVRVSADHQMST